MLLPGEFGLFGGRREEYMRMEGGELSSQLRCCPDWPGHVHHELLDILTIRKLKDVNVALCCPH